MATGHRRRWARSLSGHLEQELKCLKGEAQVVAEHIPPASGADELNVAQVGQQLMAGGTAGTLEELRGTRKPRTHHYATMDACIDLSTILAGGPWARPDEGHLPDKDAPELRELIEPGLLQQGTQGGEIARRVLRNLRRDGVITNRPNRRSSKDAELAQRERPSLRDASLEVERPTPVRSHKQRVGEFGEHDEDEDWRRERESDCGQRDVEAPLLPRKGYRHRAIQALHDDQFLIAKSVFARRTRDDARVCHGCCHFRMAACEVGARPARLDVRSLERGA
jgi:hypothetical protein